VTALDRLTGVNNCLTQNRNSVKHSGMEKRPRGRPALAERERKGEIVACRVEPDERAQFDKAAEVAGLRLSDWMRDRLKAAAKRELRRVSRSD
jgi:hypothetical protein